jgi:hypothetical protein
MIIEIDPSIIKYEHRIQNLCRVKYHNHPKGCPNFGKEFCPPNLSLIDEILDFNSKIYLIYTSFNVGIFAERMRVEHPQWEDQPREWYNCIRWQGTARKNLRKEMELAKAKYNLEVITNSPEGHGIDCSSLMKEGANIILNWQWPPPHNLENEDYKNNIKFQIAIGGFKPNKQYDLEI